MCISKISGLTRLHSFKVLKNTEVRQRLKTCLNSVFENCKGIIYDARKYVGKEHKSA